MICASHLIADGVGVVRLMQTITRAYRGEPDAPDPLPLAEIRDLGSLLYARTRREKWARRGGGLRRIREARHVPSRLAVLGGRDSDTFGFVRRTIDIDETTTPALAWRATGTTINAGGGHACGDPELRPGPVPGPGLVHRSVRCGQARCVDAVR